MVDIILSFLAVGGTSAFIFSLWNRGPVYGDGFIAGMAAFSPGGTVGAMACLLLAQALAAALAWKAVGLYWLYGVFRGRCGTPKDAGQAIEEIEQLPLSPLMRRKLRKGVVLQFMRGVWARREARMKREEQP